MISSQLSYRVGGIALLTVLMAATVFAQPQITYDPSVQPISLVERDLNRHGAVIGGRSDSTNLAEKLVEYVGGPNDLVLPPDLEKQELVAVQSELDPSASMEFDLTYGHLFINKGLAGYDDEADTPGLPDVNEVEAILMGHLKALGIDPTADQIGGVHVGGLNMAVQREDGSADDYRKLVTVSISRMLDGVPVMGASRIVGSLGEGGKLHSLVYSWTPVSSDKIEGSKDLRPDEEVQSLVEDGLLTKGADASAINVTLMDVVLYDDGLGIIEPVVYVLGEGKFTTTGPDGQPTEVTTPVDFFVPVLKTSRVKLPDGQDLPSDG